MVDATKSFDVSNDGLKVDNESANDGVWFGGGDSTPVHNASIGSIYLKTNGDWYKQAGPGTTDWEIFTGGGGAAIKFGSNSSSSAGKWLEIHRNITSNETPFVINEAGEITGFSAAIKNSGTITFGIYKNGSQVDTLVLSAVTKAYETGLSIALAAGDEISVKIESGSGVDPVFHLFLG